MRWFLLLKKLTENIVKEMRRLYKPARGLSIKNIAHKYGISYSNAIKILRGERWNKSYRRGLYE